MVTFRNMPSQAHPLMGGGAGMKWRNWSCRGSILWDEREGSHSHRTRGQPITGARSTEAIQKSLYQSERLLVESTRAATCRPGGLLCSAWTFGRCRVRIFPPALSWSERGRDITARSLEPPGSTFHAGTPAKRTDTGAGRWRQDGSIPCTRTSRSLNGPLGDSDESGCERELYPC